MSAEDTKAIVRRVLEEAINQGKLDVVDELVEPLHGKQVHRGQRQASLERVKQAIRMFRSAFPDLSITIDDQIVKGNKVVTRWTAHGTHLGDLMGIPSTGRDVTVTGIAIGKIAANKLVGYWGNFDALGLIQQLGVIPTVEPTRRSL
jgi:predicted ester cyclase